MRPLRYDVAENGVLPRSGIASLRICRRMASELSRSMFMLQNAVPVAAIQAAGCLPSNKRAAVTPLTRNSKEGEKMSAVRFAHLPGVDAAACVRPLLQDATGEETPQAAAILNLGCISS